MNRLNVCRYVHPACVTVTRRFYVRRWRQANTPTTAYAVHHRKRVYAFVTYDTVQVHSYLEVLSVLRTHARGTCGAVSLPSVLDVEASGAAELVGLAGLRHGSERRAAQVEVHGLGQARAAGALVGDDHGGRLPGACRVAVAFNLRRYARHMHTFS